jgi:glycerol-3-phosphate dehydrogenase
LQVDEAFYDLAIIGGGVNGCAIAWEATLRGLKVALVERGDFGSGTSAGNFKTIHGGLRYLQHLDFERLYESAREQRIYRQIAPHLVYPAPFLVPCYGFGMKSKELLHLATSFYELIATDRKHLPKHQNLNQAEVLEIAPFIAQQGLRGGVMFYDCMMFQTDRLTLAFARSAEKLGARLFNYSNVDALIIKDQTVEGISVTDKISGEQFQVKAKHIVNASGPALNQLLPKANRQQLESKLSLFSKGIQLAFPAIKLRSGIALESRYGDESAKLSRGKRSYFILPWRGQTLVGTADKVHRDDPDQAQITEEEILALIQEIQQVYPDPQLVRSKLLYAFGGLRPANQDLSPPKRDIIVLHKNDTTPLNNLISVFGIKYTTSRFLAERICNEFTTNSQTSASRTTPLIGGDCADFLSFQAEIFAKYGEKFSKEQLQILCCEYGTEIHQVLAYHQQGDLELSNHVLPAQIRYAVKHEHAKKLDDIIYRRTALGLNGAPSSEILTNAQKVFEEYANKR